MSRRVSGGPAHTPTGLSSHPWILTCSAISSLLEAGGQLRWAAATSASTVSVWVQSRVKRLVRRRGMPDTGQRDGRGGSRDAFEKGPQGPRPIHSSSSPHPPPAAQERRGPGPRQGVRAGLLRARGGELGPSYPACLPTSCRSLLRIINPQQTRGGGGCSPVTDHGSRWQ